MKSAECIDHILSSDRKKRRKGLEFLYRSGFPRVLKYIVTNSGTEEEARDIFQDTMAVTYNSLLRDKFRGDSPIHAYIFSIAKNLWLQELRRRKLVTTPVEDQQLSVEEKENLDVGLLKSVLARLDKECRSLLVGFYFHNKGMEQLAEDFQLSSVQVAKTKKLRCMKKLGEIIQAYGLKKGSFVI